MEVRSLGMAHLAPAPNVIRVSIEQTLGDDTFVTNVVHLSSPDAGPYTGNGLKQLAEGVYTQWLACFRDEQAKELHYTHAVAKDLSVADGAEATFVPTAPTAGSSGNTSLPANCALVVSWKEASSYRGGHPRSYLAGIPTDATVDPQHVSAAYATAIQTGANEFQATPSTIIDVEGFSIPQLVVVHFIRGLTALAPPEVRPILSALVNARLDSQRRRLKT